MQEIKTNDKGTPNNTKGAIQMNGGITSSFTDTQESQSIEVNKTYETGQEPRKIRKIINNAIIQYKPGGKYETWRSNEYTIYVLSNGDINVTIFGNDGVSTELEFTITHDNEFKTQNQKDTRHRVVSSEQLDKENAEREATDVIYADNNNQDDNVAWTKNLDEVVVIGNNKKINTTITLPEVTVIGNKKSQQININAQETATSLIRLAGLGALSKDTLTLLSHVNADMIGDIAEDISKEVINVLNERAAKLAGVYAQKITQLSLTIPTEILKYTQLRFNWTQADADLAKKSDAQLKKTIGDIIKEISLPTEKIVKEKQEKDKEAKTKNFINNVIQKAPQIINDTNKLVNESSAKIESILSYAMEGPAYIEEQMSNFIDDKLTYIDERLDNIYKSVQNEVSKFCENVGNWQGTQLVIAYNAALWVAAQALRYAQSKTTAKTQAKAKQAIQVAKLQIMSKLDIELPI